MIPEPSIHPEPVASKPKFFPGIDALRAIAILFVCFHHFFHPAWSQTLLLGNAGVDIFFVISGFLITDILLHYKETTTIRNGLRVFYMRRALRIFPLYYFYIALVLFFVWREMSLASVSSLLLYYTNFYLIHSGDANHLNGLFIHFWSLSVEEQFYLVWPALILAVPGKKIRGLIVITICGSILFSVANSLVFKIPLIEYMHPVSCMQALALGGLLTVLYRNNSMLIRRICKNALPLFALGLTAFCVSLIYYRTNIWMMALLRSGAAFCAFVAIALVIHPAGGLRIQFWKTVFDRITGSTILQFIGKISYGIYVYHNLIRFLLDPLASRLLPAGSMTYYLITAPVYTALAIGVAYLSFRFIEAPANRLKRHVTVEPKYLPGSIERLGA